MLYALIPNIHVPLMNVNVRPIKPNKSVMIYDKKEGEIDHLKNKNMIIVLKGIFFFHVVKFCLNKHLNYFSMFYVSEANVNHTVF